MNRDEYWDVVECRWVRCPRQNAGTVAAADVVPPPRRAEEISDVPVSGTGAQPR